jgi:hypothetical protein
MESKTKVAAGGLTCILWSRSSDPEESVKSSTLSSSRLVSSPEVWLPTYVDRLVTLQFIANMEYDDESWHFLQFCSGADCIRH